MFSIGQRLRELRKSRGMLREEVANVLGVTNRALTNYEADKRSLSPEQLQKLADLFDVSTDYLVGRTNDPNFVTTLGELIDVLARSVDPNDERSVRDYKLMKEHYGDAVIDKEKFGELVKIITKHISENYPEE